MNLHNDLIKVKIIHDCENCCHKCRKYGDTCENFYPENSSEFMKHVLDELRGNTVPSGEKRLKRHIVSDRKSYDDGITTLDEYYVLLINSILSSIRKGSVDHAYSLEQVRDIMRFEPDISVKYISEAGAYEIRKLR